MPDVHNEAGEDKKPDVSPERERQIAAESGFREWIYDKAFIRLGKIWEYRIGLSTAAYTILLIGFINLLANCLSSFVACTDNWPWLFLPIYYYVSVLYWDIRLNPHHKLMQEFIKNKKNNNLFST